MLLPRLAVGLDTGGADAAGFAVTAFDPSLSPSASTAAERGAWACGMGEEEIPEMEDMSSAAVKPIDGEWQHMAAAIKAFCQFALGDHGLFRRSLASALI